MAALTDPDIRAGSTIPKDAKANPDNPSDFVQEVTEFYRMSSRISPSSDPESSDFPLPLPILNHIYDELVACVFEVNKFPATFTGCCLTILTAYSAYGALPLSSCHKISGKDLHRSLSKIKRTGWSSNLQPVGSHCHAPCHQGNRVFIQFNESFDYPPALIASNMGLAHSGQDIVEFELELLRVLKFKLKHLTPYCFINILKKYVPEK